MKLYFLYNSLHNLLRSATAAATHSVAVQRCVCLIWLIFRLQRACISVVIFKNSTQPQNKNNRISAGSHGGSRSNTKNTPRRHQSLSPCISSKILFVVQEIVYIFGCAAVHWLASCSWCCCLMYLLSLSLSLYLSPAFSTLVLKAQEYDVGLFSMLPLSHSSLSVGLTCLPSFVGQAVSSWVKVT